MSHVTTVTIISHDYRNFDKAVEKLNAYLLDRYNGRGGMFKPLNSEDSAGTKYPQRKIIWGGFNYLYTSEFVDLFKSLNLEDTILILAPEDGEFYSIFSSRTEVKVDEKLL